VPSDEEWMLAALAEADAAYAVGEVPVGAILVGRDGLEVSRGRNLREGLRDPTAHAEMQALRDGSNRLQSWRLDRTTLYVTLEPCCMCAGALVQARVERVVYGCLDPKAGALESLFTIGQDPRLNHRFEITGGVRSQECAERLSRFFAGLRAQGKK
jgi:tRNA(adenine34) deaminase